MELFKVWLNGCPSAQQLFYEFRTEIIRSRKTPIASYRDLIEGYPYPGLEESQQAIIEEFADQLLTKAEVKRINAHVRQCGEPYQLFKERLDIPIRKETLSEIIK
ncbi:MAG: hypothetical protein PHS17_19670 [Desulfobacterales bacterium]|nr:hypothetical protein [Desulfobacterales bacterium]